MVTLTEGEVNPSVLNTNSPLEGFGDKLKIDFSSTTSFTPTTKLQAVVSMSESWAAELKKHNIAVSALCPAFVKTRIHESLRNLQPEYQAVKDQGGPKIASEKRVNSAEALVESGIPPSLLAKRVVEALRSGQRYIFTHPNFRSPIAYRSAKIDTAFADAENSPLVGHLKDDEIVML